MATNLKAYFRESIKEYLAIAKDRMTTKLVTQTLPAGVRDIGVAGKKIDRVVAGGLELTITSGRLTADAMIEEQFATDQTINIYYYN